MPRRRRGSSISRQTRHAAVMAASRANENEEDRNERLQNQRDRNNRRNPTEAAQRTNAQRTRRNVNERSRSNIRRQPIALDKAAFQYDETNDYSQHPAVDIGVMDQVCAHCKAKKYRNESNGLCCSNGKVKLPEILQPPEPLCTLLSRTSPESQHFLRYIQAYNNTFQMTSFGATHIVRGGYMPTFKVINRKNPSNNTQYSANINEDNSKQY